jgi:hypothetical protein
MKIIAKQIDPAIQESPFNVFGWPEDVFVFGNRDFIEHAGRIDELRDGLERIAEAVEDLHAGSLPNENLHAIIWYYFPRENGRGYTRAERLQWIKLAEDYTYTFNIVSERYILCEALELITGEKWASACLRGYSQGEWQYCIYKVANGHEWLREFEVEYFNMGEEWCIYEDNGEEWCCYTHGWNVEQARAEIADICEVNPQDVALYRFAGYTKTPKYEEVLL